eukprot:6033114-Prymnesium_polylepis.1
MLNGGVPIRLSVASATSEAPNNAAVEVLNLDPSTSWRAHPSTSTARVELNLHPPSAFHSLLLYNAGSAEIAIYASNESGGDDRRGWVGARPPRTGHAEQGDVVELLSRCRPFGNAAHGCVLLR